MNNLSNANAATFVITPEPGLTKIQQSGAARVASIGLAVVLVALPAFALLATFLTYQAGTAAKNASEQSDIFDDARYAVGSEESLERKYRLEPSKEVHALHHEAARSLVNALERARTRSAPADLVIIEEVLVKHHLYLGAIERMFAAVDAGDTKLATEIDGAEVDPSFDEIEKRVSTAALEHRATEAHHLNKLFAIQTGVAIATPAVLALGIGLAIIFWRVLGTFRREAVEAIKRETTAASRGEKRFRALVHNSSDVVLICDAGGVITYQGPTAESTWGYGAGALLRQPIITLIHADDQAAWRDFCEQLLTSPGATRTTELRLRNAEGAWVHNELILTNSLAEPAVEGMVATARDITERKTFEAELTRQALYDSLTELPNRVLLQDRIDQALSRAARRQGKIGLLFIDLDNFKSINDSLGHRSGDQLLILATARLRSCVRDENTVARLGGDEFVILLEHLSGEAEAVLVAERIGKKFSEPFRLQGRDLVVTTSIGIALSEASQAADSLLRNADIAMYSAKGGGKAKFALFEPSMHTDSLARLVLESDLRQAIERGELRVHYQPIVTLASRNVVEVEALLRWQHPKRGLMEPMTFIPLAEETGLIVPIGAWVLREACRQVAIWQREFPSNPPLTISVNLSPRQFQQANLIGEVSQALQETGLPPASLRLEITEGTIMRDVEATISTLSKLKELGIQLAIDDFGTGYSSLSYLSRLPFDILKIDRSFVSGIDRDGEDTAIVRAIIAMAKSLHLSVTGEGIETAEQATMLKEWDCDRGQGFYYSRPLEATAIAALLGKEIQPRSQIKVA